jgi:hypothetical protein
MGIIHKFSTDFQIQSSTRKIGNSIENFLFLKPDVFSPIKSLFFIVDGVSGVDHTKNARI